MKLRDSKSELMTKSQDDMFKSWDALKECLLSEGWVEPESSQTEADGAVLVGERIYAMGYGAGKVKDFVHARMGPSKHVVELEDGPRTEVIILRRKGNDKTPFLVRSVMTTTYRRKRDNLTHREPWSKGSADLSRQLSADEANSMWESFDDRLDEKQARNMFASMDGDGNLAPRENLLDVAPGEGPLLKLASGGSSSDGEDSGGAAGGGGGVTSGNIKLGAMKSGGASPQDPGPAPRVRLVDTRARPSAMARSAPEVRMRTSNHSIVRPVVASDKHRCKLTRKDWDMLPGMGLYCDSCERLCRAYGEWFSWNCPGCDFDMCNKCLEETRGKWAVVPPKDDSRMAPPSTPTKGPIDLTGDWTISMSGRAFAAASEYMLAVEHDTESGLVLGTHDLYGELNGELDGTTLVLSAGSAALAGGAEPEPQADDDDDEEDKVRCIAGMNECPPAPHAALPGSLSASTVLKRFFAWWNRTPADFRRDGLGDGRAV